MQRSYALQDGRTLRVGAERFRAPEALFRPGLLDVESPGVAELAFRCVQARVHALRGTVFWVQGFEALPGGEMHPALPPGARPRCSAGTPPVLASAAGQCPVPHAKVKLGVARSWAALLTCSGTCELACWALQAVNIR